MSTVTHKNPVQVGYRVQVTKLGDETALPEHLHKTGVVRQLTYPTDIAASYPNDPFIEVEFDNNGGSEYFWTEELTILPPSNGEAPGL